MVSAKVFKRDLSGWSESEALIVGDKILKNNDIILKREEKLTLNQRFCSLKKCM